MEERDVPSRRRAVVVAAVAGRAPREGAEARGGADRDCSVGGGPVGLTDSEPQHRFRWRDVAVGNCDAADD